jgi:hypothetical protein
MIRHNDHVAHAAGITRTSSWGINCYMQNQVLDKYYVFLFVFFAVFFYQKKRIVKKIIDKMVNESYGQNG